MSAGRMEIKPVWRGGLTLNGLHHGRRVLHPSPRTGPTNLIISAVGHRRRRADALSWNWYWAVHQCHVAHRTAGLLRYMLASIKILRKYEHGGIWVALKKEDKVGDWMYN